MLSHSRLPLNADARSSVLRLVIPASAAAPVTAALIVGRRAEAARQGLLQFYAFQKAVERQVEIEPRLFAVRDHIQSGGDLIVNRRDHGVFLQFGAIGFAELVEVLAGEFQPAGEGIAADDSCS